MADQRAIAAIEFIQEQVTELDAKALQLKQTANALAVAAGLEPVYEIANASSKGPARFGAKIRPDQFANFAAPSVAARAYLEWRGKEVGAASIDEVFEALLGGGYPFDRSRDDARNGLKVALGKDQAIARLPNGYYGLAQWYPQRRERAEKKPGRPSTPDAAEAGESAGEADQPHSADE